MYFVRTNPVHPYRKYTTTLMTVDEMVDRAIKMLQECTEKKRAISRHSPLQPKCSPGTSTPRHTQEDQEDTESTKSDVTERVEDRPAPDHNVSLMSRIKRFFKKPPSRPSPPTPTQMPDETVTPVEAFLLPDTASVSAFAPDENPDENSRAKEEIFVNSVTKDLISRALKKSGMTYTIDSLDDVHQGLFDKILEEVDSKDFNIDLNKLKELDKAIVKDLSKRLHCSTKTVGILIILKNPRVKDLIVSSFKKQLKRHSEEPGTIREMFTAIGRTLTYPTYGPTILVF
ncbi:uncharacterized protein LOC124998735 [Mugil cephalus]|uniref:uncharacterized protein LOC124998735 n=1 Tax=Mugil cephalus TaxID=48193 RepID=UPI001FB7E9D1|nr:uncharacterized protein LOC124998735 [Mugil cephalus]